MTAHANADDLIVGSSTGSHAGITIRAGGSGETNIFFADSDSGLGSYQGIIQYAHQANQFNIFTAGLQRVRIQNGGGIQLISSTPTSTNVGWTVYGGDSTNSYSTLNTHFPTTNRMMLMAGHPSNESSFVVWNKGDANTAKGFGINNAGIFKYVHGASELVRFQPDGNVNITGVVTATSYYGDGSNLSNVISGVDVKFEGASVGTGVTMLNFVGFNTVTPPASGLSTITSGQNLTIGVRSGSAVEASLTGTSFNVIARSGGNISINI